jgi:hypothetical protein
MRQHSREARETYAAERVRPLSTVVSTKVVPVKTDHLSSSCTDAWLGAYESQEIARITTAGRQSTLAKVFAPASSSVAAFIAIGSRGRETSYALSGEEKKARAADCDDYVPKRFSRR